MRDFCKYFFDKGLCNFDQIVELIRVNPEISPSEIMRRAVYPSIRIAFEEMYNGHLKDSFGWYGDRDLTAIKGSLDIITRLCAGELPCPGNEVSATDGNQTDVISVNSD